MNLIFRLLPYQAEFVQDCSTQEIALVGGRGTGKSEACAPKAITLASLNIGFDGAVLSPTGPMAAKVLIPRMQTYLDRMQREGILKYSFHKTERRFDIRFSWDPRVTKIYALSAENVRDSLGLNLAWFGIDEADTMSPDVAFEVWRKLNMAKRVGDTRQSFAVSTPEGFGFMYRNWVKDVTPENAFKRRIIHAKTRDNFFLPPGFADDIASSVPLHMREAYLEGQFVNMATGSVYPDFDKELNRSNYTAQSAWSIFPNAPLHIGMDFNVKNDSTHPYGISIIVAMILDGKPHIVDEMYGHSRTVDAIRAIKAKYPGRQIIVYPDATAKGDRTSADVSDRAQLQAAGFIDRSPMGNPSVVDRVNAVSAMILNGKGDRRLFVNPTTCPILVSCLEQQPYDEKGNPQKDTGYDDPNDALGYLINVNWPVKNAFVSHSGITY